jgi:plasmid stabilization system protein ParE
MLGRRWKSLGRNLAYDVKITDSALLDAEHYVRYLRRVTKESGPADAWFRALIAAIFTLEELPTRCPLIPEASEFQFELRHLIYRSHRVIFRVDKQRKTVMVLRIYHGSRRELREEDLEL